METIIAAAGFFAAKLSYETDPSDLAAMRATGAGPIVVDTRSVAGWAQGRIPGALHIPVSELADRARCRWRRRPIGILRGNQNGPSGFIGPCRSSLSVPITGSAR